MSDEITIDNFKRVIVIGGVGSMCEAESLTKEQIDYMQKMHLATLVDLEAFFLHYTGVTYAEQIMRDAQAILKKVNERSRLYDEPIIDRKKRSNMQTHKSPYENRKGKR